MALGQLTVRLGLDAAEFTQGMSKAEVDAYKFGESIGVGLKTAALGAVGAIAAIGTAATVAFKLVNDQIENVAAFQNLSEKIGDTAEALASIKKASDVSGVSLDTIAAASIKLTSALSKTDEEGMGAANAIKALGLDFETFKKLAPVDQIDAVSKAMAGFEDGANKTAVAVALWGKKGADMIPLLNDLANGSERQVTLTNDQILAADNFSKALTRLSSDSSTLKNQLVAQLIPTLSDLLKGFLDVGTEASNSAEKAKPFAGTMEFIRQEIKKTVADTYDAISTFKQFGVMLQTTTNFLSKMPSGLLKFDMTESKNALLEMRPQLDAITGKYKVLAENARKAGDTFKDPRVLGDPGSIADQARAGKELKFSGIKTPKAKTEKASGAEKQSEADKYLASLQKQLEATDKLTVTAALLRDIDLGRLGVLLPAQKDELILIAQQIDAVKAKELAERVAADAQKVTWDLEKKSVLENFKSYDEIEKKKRETGEQLRQSVMTDMEQIIAQEQLYNQYLTNSTITLETYGRLMDQLQVRVTALDQPFLKFKEMATTATENLVDGLANAIVQGKSLADVFKNVIKQLVVMILKALFFKAIEIGLNAVVPGLGTAVAGARAGGGNVNHGSSYLVGEKGPEMFTPSQSGRITTNANTFKQQSGGSGQLTNVYNITAPGVSREEFTAGLNRSQDGAVSDVRQNKLRRRA